MTADAKKARAPGAGRKPLPESEKRHRRTIRLTDDEWAWCEAQGNASEYLRRLIEADRRRKTPEGD